MPLAFRPPALRPAAARLAAFALVLLLAAPAALAQRRADLQPRYGIGFDALIVPTQTQVLNDGLGLGFRGRVSLPVNADLSVAAGAGFAGFVLGGRDDASYVLNPQLSAILTLPRMSWGQYIIGGIGGYFPLDSGEADGGFAIHGGIGWVRPLQETSIYLEIDPSIVIGATRATVVLPFRIGAIF